MAEIVKKDLYDTNASLYVLSCLMRKPLLMQDERYAFVKTDFYKPLQQMVFYAIYNIAQQGVEKITPQDIDMYLHQYESQYAYYKQNKGYDFVLQCYQTAEGSDDKQFNTYYNRLKKFSMLRDLEAIGIDTSEFYDTTKNALNRDQEDEKLNKTALQAIPEHIRQQLVTIENRHIGKDQGTSQAASKGLRALVSSLEEHPEVGLPLDGQIVNWATRGARLGKLYIYSAASGMGKTRYMVGNACGISMPYIDENGQVVMRGDINGSDYQKVLFVATEMSADEIQTLILAYVSGVNEKNILLGRYTAEEKERINQALNIIDKFGSNFIIECIPDPSIAMVKARITKYIVQDQVEYIFYDYIFTSPSLITEFAAADIKEYVALMMLSNTLKEIAMNYNVFIQSATQLNENWSKKDIGLRDQNCLRGSKAIADKIDVGLIGIRIPDEERKMIEGIWAQIQMQCHYKMTPNIVIDIYKNRRGDLNAVKIFRYFDFGTCRCKDLFITSANYAEVSGIGEFTFDKTTFSYLDLVSRGVLQNG